MKPITNPEDGRRLLNPCESVWAEYFFVEDGEINVVGDDGNAIYTLKVYDLNDPRKIKMRLRRQAIIQESLDVIRRGQSLHTRLLEKATRTGDVEIVEAARVMDGRLKQAWLNLELFRAVPHDARIPCSCGDESICTLPEILEDQTLDIERSVIRP